MTNRRSILSTLCTAALALLAPALAWAGRNHKQVWHPRHCWSWQCEGCGQLTREGWAHVCVRGTDYQALCNELGRARDGRAGYFRDWTAARDENARLRALLAEALRMFAGEKPDGSYVPKYPWRHNNDCRVLIARIEAALGHTKGHTDV